MKEIKTLTIKDQTYRITDPEAARIDDGAVREDAVWSGKKTVELLCPAFTESGELVVCQPVTGYPLTVEAQEGTSIVCCGKNLWDFKADVPTEPHKGIVSASGAILDRYGYKVMLPAGTYTVHAEDVSGSADDFLYAYANRADGTHLAFANLRNVAMTVTIETGDVIYVVNGKGQQKTEATKKMIGNYNVQVERGSTTSDYEAYWEELFRYDPTAPVLAKPGVNTLRASAGSITVSGRLDPVAYMEKLKNAMISMGGNV